ncbi:MAG: tyrosine-type recombinase/integrase [Magnetococcales bacterium]|nr:tyrosine-type recombinase/integrase [Magnetococcales bacterium]
MPLTDTMLRNLKPEERPYRKSDGGGLYIQVEPNGSKLWRIAYRHQKTQKTLAIGKYPIVTLKEARTKLGEVKILLDEGTDPGELRREEKTRSIARPEDDHFEPVARAWIEKRIKPTYTEKHAILVTRRLEIDVFPIIGTRPIQEIKAADVLAILERMESRGVVVSAHRVKQIIGQIFRYAVAVGKADTDPTYALRGALTPVREKHHASITDPSRIGELLRAIDGYQGSFVVRCALKLVPLVFVRSGELRHAEWTEIDFEKSEWRIPAAKMKMKEQHIVPLSKQAIAILESLRPLTGDGKYLFPGERTRERCISENTTTAALRRLGYAKEEMTTHGFRSMASTILNEHGWNRDAIELQLAHSERNSVRAAYNRAEHLQERRKMMQWWADHLDQLAGIKTKPSKR